MIAVGIGDLHLTSSVGKGGLSSYIKDHDDMVAREVTRVLRQAKKKGVKHVFLYGDLCEGTRMSYDAQLALLKILRQDFEFHIILGNHDLFAEDPTLGHSLQLIQEFIMPNVHVYTEPTVKKIEGAWVNFLPWPFTDFDDKCLNVFHNYVKGAKTDSGRKIESGNASKASAVGGHIHTNHKVRNTHYSGTLYQTNFGESKDKFYHLIEYDGSWNITNVPFKPEYTLHTVEVSTKKQLHALPRSEKDLVRLILVDGFQPVQEDLVGANVVTIKVANSARELALAKVADLREGSEVEVSTSEFFNAWVQTQMYSEALKTDAIKLRSKTLKDLSK